MTSDAVVVTGMGAASALGTGIEAHRAALWEGRDGFRVVDRFDTGAMTTQIAAMWRGWDGIKQPEVAEGRDLSATSAAFPLHELALVAAREAWANAGAGLGRGRAALVFGTCFGQGFKEFAPVADRIAAALELGGPRITISTACSSSTNAIGLGRDLLLRGHADVVIAEAPNQLMREALAGFSALGVLSAQPCAPFSDPPGTTLGEGAGFVVLERAPEAERRGAKAWASICGYGLSADGFHETTPDPAGNGVGRAIRGALHDAGWSAKDVDFVSAHATGTESNDRIEWSAITRELGARQVSVSGSKAHVGHTQGAAGALELILALICHREGRVPPTLHFRGPRDGCPPDPIAAREPRTLPVTHALKLSAAFGGANAVLAYACGAARAGADGTRASVVVTGASIVGPSGASRLATVLDGPQKPADLHSLGVDPRRLDRSARWLTAAAALALSEERAGDMERTGLFVASARMPAESSKRCTESIRQRGVAGTSASAFARMSVNAPAGACSQALGLLGPTTTLSIGEGSGLLAIVLAAEWLAWRDDASTLVAGAVDELSGASPDEAEGAACLALKRTRAPEPGAIVATGWGIAGHGRSRDAAERAMTNRMPVDALIVDCDEKSTDALIKWLAPGSALGVIPASRLWGAGVASRSGVMGAVAAAHIAARHARSVLLVAGRGGSSVALVLEVEGP